MCVLEALPGLSHQLWVIIPAYNEASIIGKVVAMAKQHFEHVVVVDDASDDATAAAAKDAGAVVLRHAVNLGQGGALQTGFQFACGHGARYIATFDADGQHDIADVIRMAGMLVRKGQDVVLGSRFLDGRSEVPPARALLLRLACGFSRKTTGLHLSDAHNGLRVMTAGAAASMNLKQPRMAHASEILARISSLNLRYAEAPVNIRYTAYSRRKGQRFWHALDILHDLVIGKFLR